MRTKETHSVMTILWLGCIVVQPVHNTEATLMPQLHNYNFAPTLPHRWIISLTDGIRLMMCRQSCCTI